MKVVQGNLLTKNPSSVTNISNEFPAKLNVIWIASGMIRPLRSSSVWTNIAKKQAGSKGLRKLIRYKLWSLRTAGCLSNRTANGSPTTLHWHMPAPSESTCIYYLVKLVRLFILDYSSCRCHLNNWYKIIGACTRYKWRWYIYVLTIFRKHKQNWFLVWCLKIVLMA